MERRITMFVGDDLNSKRIQSIFDARDIPYQTISIVRYPRKINAIKKLNLPLKLPHVFFNNRYVGGIEECVQELSRWEKVSALPMNRRERGDEAFRVSDQCLRHAYEAEILDEIMSEDFNRYLALPSPQDPKAPNRAAVPIQCKTTITLADGAPRQAGPTMRDLRLLIPGETLKFRGLVYQQAIFGSDLLVLLQDKLALKQEQAHSFAKQLVAKEFLRAVDLTKVGGSTEFREKEVYRLQCNHTPDILNSFVRWPRASANSQAASKINPAAIINNLIKLWAQVEEAGLVTSSMASCSGSFTTFNDSNDNNSLIDLVQARESEAYVIFEEAVCVLQAIPMNLFQSLSEPEMTAIALNVYSLMLKYATVQKGLPMTDADRLHLLQHTKFELAGDIFSLKGWIDDVVRGIVGMNAFSIRDDPCLLLALHVGTLVGSSWSPPFVNFTAREHEAQIALATRLFFQEDTHLCIQLKPTPVVRMSLILKQYRHEFARTDLELLQMLAMNFLEGRKQAELMAVLQDSTRLQIEYLPVESSTMAACTTGTGPWYDRRVVDAANKRNGGLGQLVKRGVARSVNGAGAGARSIVSGSLMSIGMEDKSTPPPESARSVSRGRGGRRISRRRGVSVSTCSS